MKKILTTIIFFSLFLILLSTRNIQDSHQIYLENCSSKMIKEDVFQSFLLRNIPEINNYAKYIWNKSKGEACLYIQVHEIVEMDISNKVDNKRYYPIYVGEKWENHNVNWEWFYVSEDMDVVYWYDVVEGEI